MSAIPQPPPVHWWHTETPVPLRPSEAAREPYRRLESDVRTALRPLFGEQAATFEEQVSVILGAAESFAAACIELFARPEEET